MGEDSTLAFLMTDVEGSTALWEREEAAMRIAVECHDRLAETVIAGHGGRLIKARGEGDSLFAVFPSARHAVRATAALATAFATEPWPTSVPLRVRFAVHVGDVGSRDGDFYGPVINRCGRLRGITHGGQILLSRTAAELVADGLPEGLVLRDLGSRRLRDLLRPERIHQLIVPGLPEEFPPLAALDSRPHNLPVQLTPFLGRSDDVRRVADRLAASRLVTLLGPGGGGKTRAALQVAAETADRFPDGTWFVDLAGAAESEGPLIRLTSAVPRIPPGAGGSVVAVAQALSTRRLLLLLDNCEGLELADLVAPLLAGAEGVTILATSREPIGHPAERTMLLPPLGVPATMATDLEVRASDSVQLFLDRAEAVRDDFRLTHRNLAAVAELCRRLDGMPLAIEQAASAVAIHDPREILDDLGHHLAVPRPGATGRHQTMRICTEWSLDRLSKDEGMIISRLAAFAGGCDGAAAKTLLGVPPSVALEGLRSLVRKSLVLSLDGGRGRRYRLLEPIREAVIAKVPPPESAVQDVDGYFRRLLVARGGRVETADQLDSLETLDDEAINVRRALETAPDEELPSLAMAFGAYANRRGKLAEACRGYDRALATIDPEDPRVPELSNHLGAAHWKLGRYPEARAAYERTVGADAPPQARARARNNLALLAIEDGDLQAALASYEAALVEFDALGEVAPAATVRSNIGPLLAAFQRDEDARAVLDDSREAFERLGNRAKVARVRSNAAAVALEAGRNIDAVEELTEAFAIWRTSPDPSFIGEALLDVARVLVRAGRLPDAARALGASDEIVRTCGTRLDRFQTGYREEAISALVELDRRERRTLTTKGAALSVEAAVDFGSQICRECAESAILVPKE